MARFEYLVLAVQIAGYILVCGAAFATDLRLGLAAVGISLLVEGRDTQS